jgi:hypothetical protein
MAQQIAQNLLGSGYVNSAPTLAGSTLTLIDNKLYGGSRDHEGKWLWYTPSGAAPQETRVKSFEETAYKLNLYPALSVSTATTGAYEMLSDRLSRTMINNAINQALDEAVGGYYPPEESLALHADGVSLRYDLPSEFKLVKQVYYRASVASVQIDPCDSGWTQQANVTQAFDTTRKWQGGASLRLLLDIDLGANVDLGSKTIGSLDLSKYDTIEFWALSSFSLGPPSGSFSLRLTSGVTTVAFTIPDLTQNIPAFVRVSLAPNNARQLTAVTTVVFRQVSDLLGIYTIWLDDIKAVVNDSARWLPLPKQCWHIDHENQDLVLTETGRQVAGYSLLKIVGGSHPTRMTADTDVADVPEEFIVQRAIEILTPVARDMSTREAQMMLARAAQRAEQAKASFPFLSGRKVG